MALMSRLFRFFLPNWEKDKDFFRCKSVEDSQAMFLLVSHLNRQRETACPIGNFFLQSVDFGHLTSAHLGLEIFESIGLFW